MSDTKVTTNDLIGAPEDAGILPAAPSAIEPLASNPLVVDDRMIPDAALPTDYVEGVLDIANEGSGLLRPQRFAPSDHDIYISSSQIRRFNLRGGDMVGGQARRPKENERYWGLLKVDKVNAEPVVKLGESHNFDDMTGIYAEESNKLSTDIDTFTNSMIDL